MELVLRPENLPPTETLEFKSNSMIADGRVVIQFLCGKDRLIIDLTLSARLGKGLLGNAEIKAKSEWLKGQDWEPKAFSMETQLWGMQKKSGFPLGKGILDPLSVSYALRSSPIHQVGEHRVFRTRDENREKTIELYASEKKSEATALFGMTELLKLEFREATQDGKYNNESKRNQRPDVWAFWIESESNVVTNIDVGHEKLGGLTFSLIERNI